MIGILVTTGLVLVVGIVARTVDRMHTRETSNTLLLAQETQEVEKMRQENRKLELDAQRSRRY